MYGNKKEKTTNSKVRKMTIEQIQGKLRVLKAGQVHTGTRTKKKGNGPEEYKVVGKSHQTSLYYKDLKAGLAEKQARFERHLLVIAEHAKNKARKQKKLDAQKESS